MEGVAKALLGVIGNGVHGKIAAEQILIQLFGEGDLVRMAAVGIFAIDAIGCDLIIFMMQDDGNGAMLDARIKGMVEDGLGFLGQGGGGDIPILRYAPQNGIADTAPDDIRLMTALIQFIQNPDRVLRNGNIQLLQGFSSFSEFFINELYHKITIWTKKEHLRRTDALFFYRGNNTMDFGNYFLSLGFTVTSFLSKSMKI